jgi:hypothetical protein
MQSDHLGQSYLIWERYRRPTLLYCISCKGLDADSTLDACNHQGPASVQALAGRSPSCQRNASITRSNGNSHKYSHGNFALVSNLRLPSILVCQIDIFQMAISLSFFPILAVLLLARIIEAATVTYDFDIEWVRANPDGQFERPTIGINGKWPLPVMTATVGDRVIVNVDNKLGNQSTTIHFHGLFMNGTSEMDGPAQVTQCGIPPGSQFTYNFTVSLQSQNEKRSFNSHAFRSSNLGLIGIIHTTRANTQMASEPPLLSLIPTCHIWTNSTTSSYCRSRIGTTRRCDL